MKIRTPGHPEHDATYGGGGIVLRAKEVCSLYKFAAAQGFRGLGTTHMSKLVRLRGVRYEGRKPTTEVGLLRLLVKNALGDDFTEEKLAAAFEARSTPVVPEMLASGALLFEDGHENLIEDEDMETEEVREVFKRTREKREAAEAAYRRRMQAWEEDMAAAPDAPPPEPPAPPAIVAGVAPVPKIVVRERDVNYTRAEAQEFCPPDSRIYLYENERRWRCKAHYLRGQQGKAYDGTTGLSHFQAMVHTLLFMWADYTRVSGHPCPYEFDGLAP